MPEKIVVYEKPTCTKCREVKSLLAGRNIEFESLNLFEQPLTAEGLEKLLRAAGLHAADALRTNEAAYRERIAGKNLSEHELIRIMVEHPELIQRPFVVRGDRAVLARPASELSKLGI
jgi:arsenate reductase